MSEALMDIVDVPSPLLSDAELRARAAHHLRQALEDICRVSAGAMAPNIRSRLERLIAEVSGEGRRMVAGRRPQLVQTGPLVPLAQWCDEMVAKIQAFRVEYEASMSDPTLVADFPGARTSQDWFQEVTLFEISGDGPSSDDDDDDDGDEGEET